jgi:rod shape-determining protein MreC
MSRFLKKIWNEYKEYIVLVILLLISLLLISGSENKSIKNFKSFIFGNFAVINSLISDVAKSPGYKEENLRLRNANSQLMLEVNKLREYSIINEELKSLLSLKDTSKYSLKAARIITKSFETSQETFSINLGVSDSVKPGMPVIDSEGLIGLVNSCSADYSVVRTLRNIHFKIVVKNQRSRNQGILKWNGEYLTVTNLPKTADVKVGDRIITSELSSLINTPIPVGIVTKIINPEKGWFNDLIIKPYVDFVKVENVFVLMANQSKIQNNVELNFYNRK